MSLHIRRVVTGHDHLGKAVVTHDEISANVTSRRIGQQGCVLRTTDRCPADNADPTDGAAWPVGSTMPDGTVFRIVQYDPGVAPRVHRSSSVDYAVVLSGSLVLQLGDDVEVTLHAGDMLVQRGTVHDWVNRGQQPCNVAFFLIDATPVEIIGHSLDPLR